MASYTNEVFPKLESCTKWHSDDTIFDVKFYPGETEGDEQIFAFNGKTDTVVCRTKRGANPPFEILRWFRDQDETCEYNCLAWTKCPDTGSPWLCIAGHEPKHIKILSIETGEPVRTLTGHGKGINDLAVSPLSSELLASGAEDSTIRLWNLTQHYKKQPCVALFAGAGHTAPVLAIHFHPNGKWLLSGGHDTAVCLWAVPGLNDLERKGDSGRASEPLIVYYPHFFTKELHPDYVDCFAFYGDLIFSKAARPQGENGKTGKLTVKPPVDNEILLWKIDGFYSDDPPPDEAPVPMPQVQTRSAFPHDEKFRGFHRLLTFSIPCTDRFYHRFGLLHQPNVRPILCMGTQTSRYLFWDLQKLEEGIDPNARQPAKSKKKVQSKKGAAMLSDLKGNGKGPASSSSRTQTPETSTTTSSEDREYTLGDPFKKLVAHDQVIVNTKLTTIVTTKGTTTRPFATSQIAWSPDATWMVAVGDYGMICMFYRDKGTISMDAGSDE